MGETIGTLQDAIERIKDGIKSVELALKETEMDEETRQFYRGTLNGMCAAKCTVEHFAQVLPPDIKQETE